MCGKVTERLSTGGACKLNFYHISDQIFTIALNYNFHHVCIFVCSIQSCILSILSNDKPKNIKVSTNLLLYNKEKV